MAVELGQTDAGATIVGGDGNVEMLTSAEDGVLPHSFVAVTVR